MTRLDIVDRLATGVSASKPEDEGLALKTQNSKPF